jgi:hypothetical protein
MGVTGGGVGRNKYRVLLGKSEGKNHLEGIGIDGRVWSDFIWPRTGVSGRLL